jgi:hypothetical protein
MLSGAKHLYDNLRDSSVVAPRCRGIFDEAPLPQRDIK